MKKYKIGIIGCGRIAGYLEDDPLRAKPCTHVGAYQQHPQCEVVACTSRDRENVEHFAERFSIPHTYTNYRTMLDEEQLDIVSVATYAPSHAEIVQYAARKKVQAIFCEKAMATSLTEADEMISACEQHSVQLTVNHTRRWGRDYVQLKEMIDAGIIGDVQSISGHFSGNLVHTGIHMFDVMSYVAGPGKMVWGQLTNGTLDARESSGYRYEDDNEGINDADGVVIINFDNDIIGYVTGIGKRYFVFEMDIMGSEGRIRIGNGMFQCYQRGVSKRYSEFSELQRVDIPPFQKEPSGLIFAVNDIVKSLEEGHDSRCSGRAARQSLEIALAAHESHMRGNVPIELPLTNSSRTVLSR